MIAPGWTENARIRSARPRASNSSANSAFGGFDCQSGAASGSTGYLVRAPSWGMRLPSVTRIRTWLLGRVGRLWSQLAPRRSASEIAGIAVDAVRSRPELIIKNAVLRHQV